MPPSCLKWAPSCLLLVLAPVVIGAANVAGAPGAPSRLLMTPNPSYGPCWCCNQVLRAQELQGMGQVASQLLTLFCPSGRENCLWTQRLLTELCWRKDKPTIAVVDVPQMVKNARVSQSQVVQGGAGGGAGGATGGAGGGAGGTEGGSALLEEISLQFGVDLPTGSQSQAQGSQEEVLVGTRYGEIQDRVTAPSNTDLSCLVGRVMFNFELNRHGK